MFETLILAGIAAYATLIIGGAISRVKSSPMVSDLPFAPNGEDYNEPISLLSPHNSASEITKKDGLFYVTIENSVTGDKQTLCNKNKEYLCWDAEEIATKFAVKERDEYHTV